MAESLDDFPIILEFEFLFNEFVGFLNFYANFQLFIDLLEGSEIEEV